MLDVIKVLKELRAYRAQLDDVIATIDHLARRRGLKRGRPLGSRSTTPRKRRRRKSKNS